MSYSVDYPLNLQRHFKENSNLILMHFKNGIETNT